MGKWITCLLVIGLVAAYFTKPRELQFQQRADALFSEIRASNWDKGNYLDWGKAALADIARSGHYDDYLVAAKYTITIGSEPIVDCYGAFGTVGCLPAGPERR